MADYYVATTGDNSGAGTIGDPWETVAHAVANVVAGDTVYYRGGTYDIGTGIDSAIVVDGNSGNIITHQAYNNEAVTWDLTADGIALYLNNNEYLRFEGIRFLGDTSYAASTLVYVRNSSYITFEDCEVDSVTGRGIFIRGSSNVTVNNCEVHPESKDGTLDGIQVYEATCSDITITNNEIYHTYHNAVKVQSGSDILVANNNIHDTSSHGISVGDAMNIFSQTNVVIRDNVIKRVGSWRSTADSKVGIRITYGATNVEIYRNEIIESDGPGFSFRDDVAGPIEFYNNVLYHCQYSYGTHGDNWGLIWGQTWGTAQDPHVYIKNNVIVNNVDNILLYYVEFTDHIDIDYNDWYDTASGTSFDPDAGPYASFALYQAAGYEANSIDDNPQFTNAAGDDFTLQAASNCIDAGVNVGLSYSGSAPDMGANEYEGGGPVRIVMVVPVITVTVMNP